MPYRYEAREPIYHITVRRTKREHGTVGVSVRKSWWGGPGVGASARTVLETEFALETQHTSETQLLREVLRALAEYLPANPQD